MGGLRINPTNPISWYGGATKFISGLLDAERCVENDLTNGIITGNPSHNPQASIHRKFQIMALLGRMYDLLKWLVELQKQNKELEKDTFKLALNVPNFFQVSQ